ncbi:uncharacterized protein EV422DRAFT_619352 [Fimicolochytrium jonesii]|uniref:uncharacterized protein n=1 Tax=Fimicolochytrium jonesii TaxID=1396493 RepID=UPI0022FE7E37|nr:uncharacterized protein EV422DRAFT_619352 [Fimicolochytrium jonesii]KAI8822224.1 hypothetical protein EV422DRAFT_619352 [Fimicolochytrium jonesii]
MLKSSSSAGRSKATGSTTSLSGGSGKDEAPASRKGTRDIWTLVKEMKAAEKKSGEAPDAPIESTLIFVGSRGAGKTSVVLRFLDRDDPPTPTVGMEYTFARRTRGGMNAVKDVAHIWEIAGGIRLSELVSIPLKETNIHTSTFVIVVNLSKPAETIHTLTTLLPRLHTTTTQILARLEARGSKRPKALRQFAWRKFMGGTGEKDEKEKDEKGLHPDKEFLNPSLVPLVIIGTHYDLFKDMESDPRKLLLKSLRYLAHTHGASLLFTSPSPTPSLRSLLSHHAFKTSAPRTLSTDANKPVVVLAGQDSLAAIGGPPGVLKSLGREDAVGGGRARVGWEAWKRDVDGVWPPPGNVGDREPDEQVEVEGGIEGEGVEEGRRTRVEFDKFPEPAVDALRAQKEEELQKLKRANDRKLKDLAATTTTPTTTSSRRREKEKEKAPARTSTTSARLIPAQ